MNCSRCTKSTIDLVTVNIWKGARNTDGAVLGTGWFTVEFYNELIFRDPFGAQRYSIEDINISPPPNLLQYRPWSLWKLELAGWYETIISLFIGWKNREEDI